MPTGVVDPLNQLKLFRMGIHDTGNEPFAQEASLGIASIGVEAITYHRVALSDDVGIKNEYGYGHGAEVYKGVFDLRGDGDGLLPYLNYFHLSVPQSLMRGGFRQGL